MTDLKLMSYFQRVLDEMRRHVPRNEMSDTELYLHFREVIDSRLDALATMDLKLICHLHDVLDDIRSRLSSNFALSNKEFYLHLREVIDSRLDEESR
jgi:hypothetical protein